jgi:hypothetical protein
VYNRIEGLEKIAAARRARETPSYSLVRQQLLDRVEALRDDPEYQKRVAEMPPEVLHERVSQLKQKLWERAYGNHQDSGRMMKQHQAQINGRDAV